jgi:riboflavin kinase/FMN adenylyltransferase
MHYALFMQLIRGDFSDFHGETILTIGKFDGLHVGHQALLATIRERAIAKGVLSGVVTFDPHPATVLNPTGAPLLLTNNEEKARLLEGWSIDLLVLLPFNRETMKTRAADYLDYLVSGLRPRELWLGNDFALGYKREGDIPFIKAWAEPRGIEIHSMPLVERGGEMVTATRIRNLLITGDVEGAAPLLGRAPTVRGIVQQGDQRGRTIGFPTANVIPDPLLMTPANGVYATRTTLEDGSVVPSVTNVGVRPTFDGQRRQVETHLLDWSGNLYGQEIVVQFFHRLRGEQKFSGIDSLVAQIRMDAEQAGELLAKAE